MKRLTTCLLIVCIILYVCAPCVQATSGNNVAVYINGQRSSLFSGMLINSTTYVPLRAFSMAVAGADVFWDENSSTVFVFSNGLEMQATLGAQYLIANERYLHVPEGCFDIGGTMMVPVRVIAKAFGAQVSWDARENAVRITTGGAPIQSGSTYYNADDVYWLSRIIYAESGGEPLKGQVAVGNVVLNRVAHPSFPNTIYSVIFAHSDGVYQFSPVANSTVYNTPSEQSVIAAKLCLDGAVVVSDSLFFFNPAIATSNWISDTRDYRATIGNHAFYA